jgi:hypothetical protein
MEPDARLVDGHRREIPPLRVPARSQEANGKKKLARSGRNDSCAVWPSWPM